MSSLINGDSRTSWTEQLNKPFNFVYRRRLLKLVRGNLLFPWLSNHFPRFRYILLLRHPAAVVQSQRRGGWDLSSRRLSDQQPLLDALEMHYPNQLGQPESGFSSNLIFWALENKLALTHARKSGALVIFYENLCLSPSTELLRIEDYLSTTFPANVKDAINRVSWSTKRDLDELTAEEKVSKWKSQISENELELVSEVLTAFEMDEIYNTDILPVDENV